MPGGSGTFTMVPVGQPGPTFRPEHDYFSVSLLAVHMPSKGGLLDWSRYAPVVWAAVTHHAFDGDGGRKRLLGLYPGTDEERPKFAREDRVTLIDLQLVPRMIAREELEVDFTLATVREKDFLAGVLKAASDIVASPAASFVSQIVPGAAGAAGLAKGATDAVGSVKASLDELFDADKVTSLGRYRRKLSAPMPSGIFAFVRDSEDQKALSFNETTMRLSNGKGELRTPYAVVRLQCEATRPDWMALPDLVQAWMRIRETKIAGGDVVAAIDNFRLTAETSPDLTRADAVKLTNAVKQKFAPELSGMESSELGDIGMMEESLGFFMQDSVGDIESMSAGPSFLVTDGAFSRALQMVLGHEGGYVDHAADRGGPTNRGVTQKTYHAYLRARHAELREANLDAYSVKDISDEQIAEIYYQGYWRPAHCPDMPNEALATTMFDAAVNHGPRKAVQLAQQGAGMSAYECDGLWGAQTRARLSSAAADSVGLVDGMLLSRERFYRLIVDNDPTQGAFLQGWMNRLASLKKHVSLLLATAPPGQDTESAMLSDTLESVALRPAEPDFDELWKANSPPSAAPRT